MKKKLVLFLQALKFYLYNHGLTRFPSFALRRWYLVKVLGYNIHSTAFVHMNCFFSGRHFSMDAGSVLNRRCTLDGRSGIRIGQNVSISPECYLSSLSHNVHSPDFAGRGGEIVLEDRVWLGLRAVVLHSLTLAEGSVLAANAVLTKSTEAFGIYGGTPAKKIGEREKDLRYSITWRTFLDTDIPNYPNSKRSK